MTVRSMGFDLAETRIPAGTKQGQDVAIWVGQGDHAACVSLHPRTPEFPEEVLGWCLIHPLQPAQI